MKPRTLLIIGITISLLILLGWQNTPYSSDNEPLLLLPRLRSVQVYQRKLQKWVASFQNLEGQLSVLFSSENRDLYQASQEAEKISRNLLHLYQEIDQNSPPESLEGQQEQLLETAMVFLETANLGLHWISSGDDVELAQARASLIEAHASLQRVKNSPWVKK